MSAVVLLIFKRASWGKVVKCEFNKFNNTGARMSDSIYHMTLKLLKHVCA